MPFQGALAAATAVLFVATLIAAAFEDIRHLRISNRLVLGLTAGGAAYHLVAGSGAGAVVAAALTALTILGVGILLFRQGWIGGGDVKLAAATALWLGPAGSIAFLGYTALIGALLALALLARRRAAVADSSGSASAGSGNGAQAMPYGVAIAAGALLAFTETRLGWF